MFKLDETIVQKVLDTIEPGLVNGLGVSEPGNMCVEAAVCYALGLPHGDDPGCVSSSLRTFKISINDFKWSSPKARAKGLKRLAIAQLGTKDTLDDIKFVTELAKLAKKWADAAANVAAYYAHAYAAAAADYAADAAANVAAYYAADYAPAYAADAADTAYAAADAADTAYAAADTAAADYAAYYAARVTARYAAYVAYADYAPAYAAYAAAETAARDAADAAARDAADAAARAARDKVLSDACEDVVQLLISMNAPGTKYLYLTEK